MDNDELLVAIKDMFEKNIEKMEKRFDEKVDEVKCHVGVVAEGLRSDIKVVAEGHNSLNNKLDRVETDIKSLKSDMAAVKGYVVGVDN